jgi:arylsulfatase A-like enzyme
MYKKAAFLLLFSLFFSFSKEGPQNFVFILVDDLGWSDVGYNGSIFYETPQIDLLSKSSVRFTNAYASGSVCSPSRAAILTGKHPARLQITDWIPGQRPANRKLDCPPILNQLQLEESTIAEVLKEHNYKTFFAGKWHLGSQTYFPEQQGFDINIGGHEKGSPPGGYYSPYKNPELTDGPEGEYLTDRLTDESIGFIENTQDKPFFLYLNYYTVHTPIQPNTAYIKKFEDKLKLLKINERQYKTEGNGISMLDQYNPAYASMLYALDKNVGRLVAKLKEAKLYENTTIIFTSDNGGLSTLEQNANYIPQAPTSSLPLRGGKGWLYEGGIRVPLLIKPAHYEEEFQKVNEPVIGHDFFPTILSLANISKTNYGEIDGENLTPLLINKGKLDRKDLFWHYPHYHGSGWTPGAAIRQGNWKLIEFYESDTVELYNLAEDLSETNDLSEIHPQKVEMLSRRLRELQQANNAKYTTVNKGFK